MPNEVFLRTRAGLTALVSSRAAGRILEGALKVRGHDPEDVDLPQMRSALLGPVMQELEGVLPRAGLRRNLERLARSLRPTAPPTELPEPAEDAAVLKNGHAEADEPEPDCDTAETAGAESEPGAVEDGDVEVDRAAAPEPPEAPAVAADVAAKPATTPRVIEPLATLDLERHVQRFAQIEHVRLVSVIRGDGSVAINRGNGPDPALLARFCRLALTLLAKGGAVRQVHLGHTAGQLFLYPLGHDLLVIVGGVELNLGTVTTAFTALALEEDL